MKPLLFPSALQHRNFVDTRKKLIKIVRNAPPGKVIALVGPTQAGKSLIFNQLIEELNTGLRPSGPSTMPIVSLGVETSQDGRISPKHLALMLLKAVRHPLYARVGDLDELDHYRPSRNRDEGSMRTALGSALKARETMYVLLDEAHHLTHSKSHSLRSNVLDSIKCLGAIDRTLVLVGGYELAYCGLFDSAHFAGRLVCFDFPAYTSTQEDMSEWERILKFVSKYVAVTPPTLLLDEAQALLFASNGSFGLLEKILWSAGALSCGDKINRAQLHASFPMKWEHEVIRRDILQGVNAVQRLNVSGVDESTVVRPINRKHRSKPFQRKPSRKKPPYPEVRDE